MSQAEPTSPAPRLTLGHILGVAAVTGLAAGALFAVDDTARVCKAYRWWAINSTVGLGSILSMAFRAMAWYGAAGCGLALLIGVGAWSLGRLHGYRLDTARVAALAAGACMFIVLSAPIRERTAAHIAGMTLFGAIGFGCGAWAIARWAGTVARLAAAAAGLVAAAAVYTCWAEWLVRVKGVRNAGLKDKLTHGAVILLAVALGLGLFFLLQALLDRRGRRAPWRAALGAALAGVSAALLAAGSSALSLPEPGLVPAARPDDRPNIVWLLLDTARADAFSCYGAPRGTSPCVDRLAAEGALFEAAFAPAGWTLPSHASMFTGLLPSRHGTTAEQVVLPDEFTTIAEVLAGAGYSTFGCSSNLYVSPSHNLTQGFQRFHTAPWGRGPEYELVVEQVRRGLHLADDGAAASNQVATQWIGEAHNAHRPFFLFINYFEIHNPYGSTPCLARWLPAGVSLRKALRISQDTYDYATGAVSPEKTDFGVLRALYEGDVTYLDERVGELADHLRGLGILDNTLFIVTADHGEELGEHGAIGHAFGLRNTLLRVPLVVRYPKQFHPGTRRPDIVELVDLFPTILDVAGLAWDGPPKLDGRSLLAEPRPAAEQFAVAQRDLPIEWLAKMLLTFESSNALPQARHFTCIQDRRFKYLWASDNTAELFDLENDPIENHNVLDRFPREAARLRAALEARVGRLRPGLSAAALANAPPLPARNTRSTP